MYKINFIFLSLALVSLTQTKAPLPNYDFDSGVHPVWVKPSNYSLYEVHRWYINKNTAKCERFLYKGVGGNFNNFPTHKECEKHLTFTPNEKLAACRLPKDQGKCTKNLNAGEEKWYFSTITESDGSVEAGHCAPFIYSGCGGNGNVFDSEDECLNACQNDENGVPYEDENDKIITRPFPNKFDCGIKHTAGDNVVGKFVPDYIQNRCVLGAVSSTSKRGFFSNAPECVETCFDSYIKACDGTPVQYVPQEIITADQSHVHVKYFFDQTDKVCKRFETFVNSTHPTPFDKNVNVFDSAELCASYCPATAHIKPIQLVDVCLLPKAGEKTWGKYQMKRFFYNKLTQKCEEFKYGGLDGNMNNFKLKSECMAVCRPDMEAVADDPPATAPEGSTTGEDVASDSSGSTGGKY